MKKRLLFFLSILTVLAMFVTACAPAATPEPQPVEPTTETAVEQVQPTPIPTEAPEPTEVPAPQEMILATTSSTQDSGLLDYLLPMFLEEANIKTNVIAVGSGQALQMGKDGDADVLLVHSPAAEKEFMEAGHGVRREDVMYNDFVIVGPEGDPAKIAGVKTAADAFKTIANAKSKFISRGDDSGTHVKEKGIWKKAAIEPAGDWYVSAGNTMGAVLTMTDELQGYTLSDRATYLSMVSGGLTLKILVEGDASLLNPYGVIAVDPAKNPNIKNDLANTFIDWLISVPTQEAIQAFKKEELGQSLFYANSALWLEANQPEADLEITGKVDEEQSWTEEDVKALETMDVQMANKDGKMVDYTGVSLSELLALADPSDDANTLVLVAADGYSAEVPLEDAEKCELCIVAFVDEGGFRMVMPDFSTKAQVKDLVEIQVK